MPKLYEWEKIYQQALEEKDPTKISARRAAAEKAFKARRKELTGQRTRAAINEQAWLQKAVARMDKLRASE